VQPNVYASAFRPELAVPSCGGRREEGTSGPGSEGALGSVGPDRRRTFSLSTPVYAKAGELSLSLVMADARLVDTKSSFASFSHLIDARLLRALADLGFARPTLVQAKAIPLALDSRDILARARTGSGKTAAYCIPLVQKILNVKVCQHPSIYIRDGCGWPELLLLHPLDHRRRRRRY
jgi:hypothetical protein